MVPVREDRLETKGAALEGSNKLAYSGHQELPIVQMRKHRDRPLCGSF